MAGTTTPSPLHRLRRVKAALLAVSLTLAGILLIMLAAWLNHLDLGTWNWLHSFPLTELGGTLFGAGVLSTLFEYTFRRDQEESTVARFRQTIRDEAPTLRDALIEAFRSTLEEVAGADLVLHVVDAAHPDPLGQVTAVRAVLADIPGALDVPELIALNKVDLVDAVALAALRTRLPGAIEVSARSGEGIEEMRSRIEAMLPRPDRPVDVVVPYSRGDLVSRVHADGEIDAVEYGEAGTRVVARVDPALAAELEAASEPAP